MSIPKEKQFLPEPVPVRFWWQELQPWGLPLHCLLTDGRGLPPLKRYSRPVSRAGDSCRPFALVGGESKR